MMEWFEKLDFYENPLSTKPDRFVKHLAGVGSLLEDLFYRVDAGSMVFIEGPDGLGKTSILMRLVQKFKGSKKVIYFDCKEIDNKANIEDLMYKRYGLFGKLLRITPKSMILLLDNAALSYKNAERVKYYFDEGYIKSVVFTGGSYSSAKLPESVRSRIGSRVVKLAAPSEADAVYAVRKRLGKAVFTDDELRKMYSRSKGNMKKFLESCESAAKKIVYEKGEKAYEPEINSAGDDVGKAMVP